VETQETLTNSIIVEKAVLLEDNLISDVSNFGSDVTHIVGRAISQGVSRWLPTSATRVESRV
jgi:hypothetical protein